LGRVEKSIEIKAPPEKVWEMLALDKIQEWEEIMGENLEKLEYTSEVQTPEDKYRIGATAHIIKEHEKLDFEVIESLENEKIVYRIEEPKMKARLTYTLHPIEDGTKFIRVVDYEMPWGIFGKLVEKLFVKIGGRAIERALKNLKNILEE